MTQELGPNQRTVERPNRRDKSVTDEVAKRLLKNVVGWLKSNGESDPNEEEVLEQLQDAIQDCFDEDGYKFAKELEDHHYWDANADLVDILDGANHWSVLREQVKAWVAKNDIKPLFEVGASVRFRSGRGEMTGTIVRVDLEHATYTIQEDGKQYKAPRPGDDFREGILIDFEKVVGAK